MVDAAADRSGRVSFGIKTSQANTTYDEILRTWREADAIPEFEHAWLWDHLVPLRGEVTGPALEAWTLLAALAAETEHLRLGIIVTDNRIRPPAVLAKMAHHRRHRVGRAARVRHRGRRKRRVGSGRSSPGRA